MTFSPCLDTGGGFCYDGKTTAGKEPLIVFNVNSIATYIQQPDLINIELTEAIWTELGWSEKRNAVRKLQDELIEDTDYRMLKVEQAGLGIGYSNSYYLSYNGLKILAASTTSAKGKAYRRHLVETENKYIQLMKEKSSGAISEKQVIELAYEALGRQVAQNNYCADKPGLRNIINQASQPNTLDMPKAGVEAITLHHFNVELTKGELNSLGRLCAATYRTWHNSEPERDLDYHNGSTSSYAVCIYGTEMYATIENWLINKGYSVA
jgi:hypothetical protein